MDKDGERFSQTIFYNQLEAQGDRFVNHLKGFYISPQQSIGYINYWYYDYTVVDYDINLPTADFHVATIGASQYIYFYDNFIAASALAKAHPELFADEGTVSNAVAVANRKKLAEYGVHRLDYALDEASGKLVLQNRDELVANAGEEAASLYALEVNAPDGIDINFDVHDIAVSHRLYSDYYGEDILDITLSNFYQNEEEIALTCAMYLNGASEPVYVSLPYRPEVISTGASTTVSVPLKALFDPAAVRTARFVFTPRGIRETATLNNEFTIYPGGGGDPLRFTRQPEDVTVQAARTCASRWRSPAASSPTPTSGRSSTRRPESGST